MKIVTPRPYSLPSIIQYVIVWMVVFLLAIVSVKPSHSQDFISDNEMWASFPYPALGCRVQRIAILTELNRLKTSVRMGYATNTPYDIAGDQGTLSIKQSQYEVGFLLPVITNHHHFTLKFSSTEKNSNINATSITDNSESAAFNLNTDNSSDAFLFAHYLERFNLSWGGEVKLANRGSETKTESAWEIGWGDLSNSRLRFRYSQEFTDTPWFWHLDSDSMLGELNNLIIGKLAEVSFGDPFGVHLTMTAAEEEFIKDDPSVEDVETVNLESDFTRSYVSIKLKKNPPHKISWWIGGVHLNGSGELALRSSADESSIRSHAATVNFDEWGGKVNFPLGKYHMLSFLSEYYSWKIYSDGFLFPANLPFSFADVFSDTTVFFVDSKVHGVAARSEINRHRGSYNTGLKVGLSKLWINSNIEDYTYNASADDPTRQTTLSLTEASLGFITLRASYNYRKITLGGSVSQAFLLNQKTDGREVFGDTSQQGGTKAKVWLELNF